MPLKHEGEKKWGQKTSGPTSHYLLALIPHCCDETRVVKISLLITKMAPGDIPSLSFVEGEVL